MSLAGQHTKGNKVYLGGIPSSRVGPKYTIPRYRTDFGCHIHGSTFRIINLEETDQPSLYKKYDLSSSSNRYAKLMFNLFNRVQQKFRTRSLRALKKYSIFMVRKL